MTRNLLSIPPVPAIERIAYGNDPSQFFELYVPPAPRAIAMMIHGGFWRAKYDLNHVSHMCDALAKSGIAVANLEYRRVGNAGGGWPGSYEDVRRGYAAVRNHFGGGWKCVVIGHSAGGHLALRLAIDECALGGIVALAPVAVLRRAFDLNLSNGAVVDFLGGTPVDIPDVYAAACPSLQPSPVRRILLHGDGDTDVPISISKDFEAARQNDSGAVRLETLEQTGHMDLIDPESSAWSNISRNVKQLIDG